MNCEIITPTSEDHWLSLRIDDVTSTESSALFAMNPYITEFELWHRKKNKEIVKLESNERMKWGNRLESAIGHGIAEDQGWNIMPFKDYGRLPDKRAGSSFDFRIFDHESNQEGLLEIKNVDALQIKEKWIVEDGEVVEAPPHIEIQVQHQLWMTGCPVAYIGALVGGNSVKLLKRRPQPHIMQKIEKKIFQFWASIAANDPPKPDYERDAEFVASLHNHAEPGSVMDGNENSVLEGLVLKYKLFADQEKDATKGKKATKAQILEIIGDHERVVADTYSISAGLRGPVDIEAHTRAGFRDFRVFKKKPKGDK